MSEPSDLDEFARERLEADIAENWELCRDLARRVARSDRREFMEDIHHFYNDKVFPKGVEIEAATALQLHIAFQRLTELGVPEETALGIVEFVALTVSSEAIRRKSLDFIRHANIALGKGMDSREVEETRLTLDELQGTSERLNKASLACRLPESDPVPDWLGEAGDDWAAETIPANYKGDRVHTISQLRVILSGLHHLGVPRESARRVVYDVMESVQCDMDDLPSEPA